MRRLLQLEYRDIVAPIAYGLGLIVLWTLGWLLLRLLAHLIPAFAHGAGPFFYWFVLKLVFWVAPAILFLRYRGDKFLDALGARDPKQTLKWGFAAGGVFFGLNLAVSAFTFSPLPFGFSALNLYLINPVVEELAFRAAILPTLARKFSFVWANTITALLFTLVHFPGWFFQGRLLDMIAAPLGGALSIFILGWLFGFVAYRSNSVGAPIIAHSLNNLSIPV